MCRSGLPFSAAEAHGIAVGLGSGGAADAREEWRAAVYVGSTPDDALAAETRSLLEQLFAAARQQLQDEAFGLQLFLPDDNPEQGALVQALRDWARGFLCGLGLCGTDLQQRLSPAGHEALRDVYEIANLAVGDEALSEAEQQAAAELEEYMRVAAMLIHEEVRAGKASATGDAQH